MVILICFTVAMLAAFVGSLAGLGGGVVLIPLLFLANGNIEGFEWITPQTVVAMSLFVMCFTGISSALSFAKTERIDYKAGALFLIGSIPGSMCGAWLNQFVQANTFYIYFGSLIILIAAILFYRQLKGMQPRSVDTSEKGSRQAKLGTQIYTYKIRALPAIMIAFFVGMLSGFFGIGGGAIMVPVMLLVFGFPAHIATATSMFMIIFVSLFGSITHVILGNVAWAYVLFFIPGAWIGGKIGALINQKISSSLLELFLRILLIIMGIRMILQGIG
ncbi:sulfite exporter TauE/SafE family protein [Oceanobacillus timonensis]|uniref:sulfite exporter TauE/SafE family protein n=1 Tax=Oceanobacillus timonensis TaxID=1926285 RepID=UPI001FE79E9F|nr:sulfite exporter TauE/SafE family protein [Oceanobacillus timonensis]